jgi:hypothetical protein
MLKNDFWMKKYLSLDFSATIAVRIWVKAEDALSVFFFQNKLGWMTCRSP